MMLPLGRGSFALRRGACASSLTLLRTRQCLPRRCYSQSSDPEARATADGTINETYKKDILGLWEKYSNADLPLKNTRPGKYSGLLGKKRAVSKSLIFADLTTSSGEVIQLCADAANDPEAHALLRDVPAFSPVLVDVINETSKNETVGEPSSASSKPTVSLTNLRTLNSVPKDLIVTKEVNFPPNKRHYQIKFHPELQARLKFRSWLKAELTKGLLNKGFVDVETPTLFKSTPEGAREFLVPTRRRGMAYALNQSPQQYKQILMASGIGQYMQWARCYRDEDSRADRQPEFTQLDMEWSFAGAAKVRQDVNDIVLDALAALRPAHSYKEIRKQRVPVLTEIPDGPQPSDEPLAHEFTTIKFQDSIASYGTDKPDLRIPNKVHALPDLEPYRQFVSMITDIEDPLVEAFTFPLENCSPQEAREFVIKFMDDLPTGLANNPDGQPSVLVYDSSKPLMGLSSVGFEFEAILDLVSEGKELNDGDLIVFQAREKPQGQYCKGSTKIGEMRSALWKALVEAEYMSTPKLGTPGSLQFVWVTEFPMFKPVEEGEPGQEGSAGIAASHHPFTAPLSQADLELLFTNPLDAKSAAYDLVLNGVEVGGGSERIHVAEVQKFIMQDILKVPKKRIADFAHLFEALQSGCPPHAGFALGFDRLVALMTDTSTVRDAMAFPKTMKGEDPLVKSPSKLTKEQLEPYGLYLRGQKDS
ncbi:aspartate--tRNA ligase msd1 [Fusarium falciforme]